MRHPSRKEAEPFSIRWAFLVIAVSWTFLGAWGCARQEFYKPKGWKWKVSKGELASWKQGILPNGSMASHFEIFAKGVEKRAVGARKLRSFRVGMNVNNNTGKPLEIDSQEAYLVDRGGEVLRCSAMRVSGALKPSTKLRPNAHAILDLYFDMGRQTRDMKDFSVHWRYSVDGTAFSQSSKFERDFHGWAD